MSCQVEFDRNRDRSISRLEKNWIWGIYKTVAKKLKETSKIEMQQKRMSISTLSILLRKFGYVL